LDIIDGVASGIENGTAGFNGGEGLVSEREGNGRGEKSAAREQEEQEEQEFSEDRAMHHDEGLSMFVASISEARGV
jgi:hypothetical protein